MNTRLCCLSVLQYIVVTSCLLLATGCGGGGGDGDEEPSAYAGTYAGSFTGDDSGSFNVVADEDGRISGSGFSEDSGRFLITGDVDDDGEVEFVAGSASTGATFSGHIRDDFVSGTWRNTRYGESGSFSGTRVIPTATFTTG